MNKATVRIRPTILLFGDSITEFAFGESYQVGWASLLSSMYSRRADVLSRGFSGYNTKHALGVMETVFRPHDDRANAIEQTAAFIPNTYESKYSIPLLFCTVFFGANDASLPTARQYLPIDEYEQNIRKIISGIRKKTVAQTKDANANDQVPIILFTPPPVSSKAWDHYCTVTSPRPLSPRSNQRSKEYGLKVQAIGAEMGCAVVDTFTILGGDGEEEHYSQYLTDGLHLNGEGNKIVFQGLVDKLRQSHPSLLPSESNEENCEGVPLEEKLWNELC